MWLLIKAVVLIAAVAVGSVLLVDNVPSLKANILEVVNPRAQEGKLVQKLNDTLAELETVDTNSARDALIAKSKELLQNISELNEEHSGIVDGLVSTVTEALLGTSASPSPTSTPAVVTVTVTPAECR